MNCPNCQQTWCSYRGTSGDLVFMCSMYLESPLANLGRATSSTLMGIEKKNQESVNEKLIVNLKEENNYLESENSELRAKLQELESQIEKMKNCDNCKNKPLDSDFQDSYNSGYFDPYCTKCIKFSNWELK